MGPSHLGWAQGHTVDQWKCRNSAAENVILYHRNAGLEGISMDHLIHFPALMQVQV